MQRSPGPEEMAEGRCLSWRELREKASECVELLNAKQVKAWSLGRDPKVQARNGLSPRSGATEFELGFCRTLRGLLDLFAAQDLGLTPQALCFRPLRGLRQVPTHQERDDQ